MPMPRWAAHWSMPADMGDAGEQEDHREVGRDKQGDTFEHGLSLSWRLAHGAARYKFSGRTLNDSSPEALVASGMRPGKRGGGTASPKLSSRAPMDLRNLSN